MKIKNHSFIRNTLQRIGFLIKNWYVKKLIHKTKIHDHANFFIFLSNNVRSTNMIIFLNRGYGAVFYILFTQIVPLSNMLFIYNTFS